MKKKTLAGLIAIVIVASVAMFAEGVEKKTIDSKKLWEDDQIGITLDKVERTEVSAPEIAGGRSPRPKQGYEYLIINLTVKYIKNVHIVNLLGYKKEESILTDIEGRKYKMVDGRWQVFIEPTKITNFTEKNIKYIEGTSGFFIFELPKNAKPAKLEFIYSFTESRENVSVNRGQMEIDLQVTSAPTLTPTVNLIPPTPTPSPTAAATEVPTPEEKEIPEFDVIFAIAGLLAVAYLLRRKK